MRLLLLLALGLLLLAPFATAFSIERPGHAPGDEWTYAVVVMDAGAKVEEGERHVVVLSSGEVFEEHQSRNERQLADHPFPALDIRYDQGGPQIDWPRVPASRGS